MKKLFVSVLAIAALAACANEEIVSMDKGEAIQFGNAFVNNSTRATDPSYSTKNIESLLVYGTVNNQNIFDAAIVSKTGDYGSIWSCEDALGNEIKQYWIAGANYKFVGIVDGEKDGVTTTDVDQTTKMPTTITYNADGKTDLLCATVERPNNTIYDTVAFTFTHLLSKVNFTVTNKTKDAVGYSFVVKNINFNGNTAGVYDVVDGAWDTTQFTTGNTAVGNERTVEGASVKDIVVASGAASNELSTEVLFLPGEYVITFDVDIIYNDEVITTTSYPATTGAYTYDLDAAKSYNFNVDVAVGQKINFTVKQQPAWTNANPSDLN